MPNPIASTVTLSRLRRLAADGTARRVREAHLLSLTDVGNAVGVSKASVSKWERGLQVPRGDPARRYAKLIAALLNDESPSVTSRGSRKTTGRRARNVARA
jgi:transcriptional regulator with XRE-family HTH domain